MDPMNETTRRLIHWIWRDPKLADFMRQIITQNSPVRDGEDYEFTDLQTGCHLADLVAAGPERDAVWCSIVEESGLDTEALESVLKAFTTGRDPDDWLDEMQADWIRVALTGGRNTGIYVHVRIKGFHPRNRYRVHDRFGVYESGWFSGSGFWTIGESDRQICLEPIGATCSCMVAQRER